MDKNEVKSRQTQLLRRAKNRVDNLLNMNVLDSDTRHLLLQEAMAPLHGSPSRSSLSCTNMLKNHSAQSLSNATKPFLTPLKIQEGDQVKANDPERMPSSYARASGRSGSGDLITSMAARLKELEKTHKIYQSELKEMHNKYHDLELSFQKETQKREEAEALLVELYDEKKHLEELIHRHSPRVHSHGGDPSRRTRHTTPDSSLVLQEGSTSWLEGGTGGSGSSLRGATPDPDHVRLTAERGLVDPRNALPRQGPAAVMLFNPFPRDGGGDDLVLRRRPSSPSSPALDVARMVRNARVLSDHVGRKEVVVADGHGHIANREVVSVVVYKNGISVNDGAFRPYTWPLCMAFVQDLMEGYYPYEFKDRYPGGFPIEVIDKSSEDWQPLANKPRPSSVGAAANAAMNLRPRNVHSLQNPQSPLSKEGFLQQLPATRVTANGRLVDVRNTITSLFQKNAAEYLGPNSENPANETIRHATTAERAYFTKLEKLESQQHQKSGAEPPKNDVTAIGNLISLLIRLPNGKKVVMRMSPNNTIEQLHKELLKASPEITRIYKDFEFCQAFPFRLYSERAETLKNIGLSGNCMLLLRVLK
ncbi:unnamed protein product [Phytomonas sp. Hart1]|nr:unnamed protein product [Phytomonas sp. Hart1]|eukprot:CCW69964.1 unnamed protein product [Phytomonas sp. isolate Hart1]